MKIKAISTLIFFLAFPDLLPAQLLVGPIVGGQYSWTNFDDRDSKAWYSVKPVSGFHAGLAVSFRVRKRFFLHSSFLYSTKGRILEGKEDPALRDEVTYHYIDVPLIYTVDFKGRIGHSKEFKYYLGLGPSISYWLGGKGTIYTSDFREYDRPVQAYKISFDKAPNDTEMDEMTIEDPNRIQLGLNLAAGMVFEPFGYQKILFMVRYEFGHSYLSRTSSGFFPGTYHQDELRTRNQGFRVSLAYLIDLRIENRKRGKSTIDLKRN